MLDFFKTASGSYNLVLVVSVVAWTVSTFGVLASLHKHRSDTMSALAAKREAEKGKQQEEQRRIEAEFRLAAAETEIVNLRPKPLSYRVHELLKKIDPKILPALKQGRTDFEGGITASQFTALQTLASEPGAERLIKVSPDVKMGLGMGPEGITYGVTFQLTQQVLIE